ncbi:MAG: hypothetical protein EOP07_27075 [Proteobacteria bacterium]|nr:MAG: hypothetical protein EOP07_27075 [Pseudomonadota bacterium]
MTFKPENFNFEKCEEEKITIPESIQSFGVLFAVIPGTGEIRRVSSNAVDVINFRARSQPVSSQKYLL